MTHSRARKVPWLALPVNYRHYVTERTDDMDYWQRLAASATARWRTKRRWVARRDEAGAIYIVRTQL